MPPLLRFGSMSGAAATCSAATGAVSDTAETAGAGAAATLLAMSFTTLIWAIADGAVAGLGFLGLGAAGLGGATGAALAGAPPAVASRPGDGSILTVSTEECARMRGSEMPGSHRNTACNNMENARAKATRRSKDWKWAFTG